MAGVEVKLQRELEMLSRDREQGAAQIYRQAASLLHRFIVTSDTLDSFDQLVVNLLKAQSSMAPLVNLCNRVSLLVEKKRLQEAVGFLRGEMQEKDFPQATVDALCRALEGVKRVVVFSYSSTVARVLVGINLRLPVLTHVGEPIKDGEKSAEWLSERGLDVTVTSDLCLPGMLEPGDVLLTGCDAVTTHGLVNRAGTYPLALAGREVGVPLVVLTETFKFLPRPLDSILELGNAPPEELSTKCRECRVNHRYFEYVPLGLLYRVITEKGEFSHRELKGIVDRETEVSGILGAYLQENDG